jgi:FAD/FMN-containing dehydrogenase/Fe-S oxidoreductase
LNAPSFPVRVVAARPGDSALAARLRKELDAEVLFDRASRGRYSTDASIYQIEPVGIVVPRTEEAARTALAIAAEAGVPILPRGAGSSQCGQAVGEALLIDHTKYLNRIVEVEGERAVVQPGVVLDQLNAALRPKALWFAVDVSTSAQATIGGMAGNNSCGSRSIAYGNMVHNVLAIDACTVSGERWRFGPMDDAGGPPAYQAFLRKLKELYRREQAEIEARFPKLLRKVAGYNLDHLGPPHANAAHLLVGSEGTLAYSERLHLKLSRLPEKRSLGVCHFPKFYTAMELTQHIVKLGPSAVELVDRTMIGLARGIAAFRNTVDAFIRGAPDAILLVEFADERVARLKDLVQLMADFGLPGSVVEVTDAKQQRDIWEVRKAGLNIMMSMKGDGKPVSFIEDCAVPLEHLAEYTDRLTRVFEKHGTRGTWYAHASVGTLHVRPILDMRRDGALKMRAIAEEACAMVKDYKGAYSGEHGDGLVRSEWIAPFFGPRLTAALGEIKSWLDPRGLMNPGKIVDPPKMDDASLFRFKPGYRAQVPPTVLDWSEWGGYDKAVEMCNNNGHCRKFDAGTMCPSFRATRDEIHLTRGRANTLRLALSGQLGADGEAAVKEALDLCVSCKGCKRDCPTGVDMARMKIEFLAQYKRNHGHSARDCAIGYLPRYAPFAAVLAPLANLGTKMLKGALGFADRPLPRWRRDYFRDTGVPNGDVVLFVDTFNRYFEPENAHAAKAVLEAAGYRVQAPSGLCCGRTFLSVGMVDEARREAQRMIDVLGPLAARSVPIVGLEPSCLFSLRDEFPVLMKGAEKLAQSAFLFEEFLARNPGRLKFREMKQDVLLHGHCHQKAFDAMPAVQKVLAMVPGLAAKMVETSCCGMAGSFGYEAEHAGVSMKMAELSLLPAIRNAPQDLLVADGTSCRHQILDGTGRQAVHVARVLESALSGPRAGTSPAKP